MAIYTKKNLPATLTNSKNKSLNYKTNRSFNCVQDDNTKNTVMLSGAETSIWLCATKLYLIPYNI